MRGLLGYACPLKWMGAWGRRPLEAEAPRLSLLLVLLLTAALLRPTSAQSPPAGKAVIEILDVGQGDAILIRSPEGKAALIDAGPSKNIVDTLHESGVEQLDLVIVTHHHTDHYGGMDDVIREFHPKYFMATDSKHTTSQWLKLIQHVKDYDITALQPKREQSRTIRLGSVELIILPQPPEDLEEENDNSIGVRLNYGNLHILMTGDSEEPARAFWLEHCPDLVRDCQILKLAHHGSHNGTDAGWLDVVQPRVAVVSLAGGNSYGHPHREVVQLLSDYNIPMLRTDQRGTIRIETDGERTNITSSRNASTLASRPRSGGTRATSKTKAAAEGPSVNINTASRRELESSFGVNGNVSREIIRNRPYRSVSDLEAIDGLTPDQLARIQPRATVR